jgi:site-specific DNA-methyltransferase (adenine-specific)
VLDPFGGSGTTYVAAELTGRRWIGSELHCEDIVSRFENLEGDREHLQRIQANKNTLFTQADLERRRKNGKPLSKDYRLEITENDCACAVSEPEQKDMFVTNS